MVAQLFIDIMKQYVRLSYNLFFVSIFFTINDSQFTDKFSYALSQFEAVESLNERLLFIRPFSFVS